MIIRNSAWFHQDAFYRIHLVDIIKLFCEKRKDTSAVKLIVRIAPRK